MGFFLFTLSPNSFFWLRIFKGKLWNSQRNEQQSKINPENQVVFGRIGQFKSENSGILSPFYSFEAFWCICWIHMFFFLSRISFSNFLFFFLDSFQFLLFFVTCWFSFLMTLKSLNKDCHMKLSLDLVFSSFLHHIFYFLLYDLANLSY